MSTARRFVIHTHLLPRLRAVSASRLLLKAAPVSRFANALVAKARKSSVFYLWNYLDDCVRFFRYSGIGSLRSTTQNRARVIRQTHIIEKGLALRQPVTTLATFRPESLIEDLVRYEAQTGGRDKFFFHGIAALTEYFRLFPKSPQPERFLFLQDGLSGQANSASPTVRITRAQTHAAGKQDLGPFFASRKSVRQFAKAPVDDNLLQAAVSMAINTPSACNRQPCKVYALSGEQKARALQLQGGNRGFSEEVNKVLIITAHLGTCLTIGERNQGWVDGGMFAVTVVYALHSLGLGTCCLNWGKDRLVDRRAKKVLGIPDSETIIMMVAVGHLPDEFAVAASPRRDVDEVLALELPVRTQ